MKKFNHFLLILIIVLGFTHAIKAQEPVCFGQVDVSLTPFGSGVLFPNIFVENSDEVLDLLVSRDNINFDSSISFDCADVGQTITVYVKKSDDTGSCTSEVTVHDYFAPIAICVNLATALPSSNDDFVEVFAKDLDFGSSDNCTVNLTFGDFPFNFAPEVIEGVTVDRTIDHYFDNNGPIAAVTNASASVIQDYEGGLIQLWDASEKSSSKIYFAGEQEIIVDVDLMVTDEAGLNVYCSTELSIGAVETDLEAGICVSDTIFSESFSCGPEFLYAEDYVDPAVTFTDATISYDGINFSPSLSGNDLESGTTQLYVKYNVGGDLYGCYASIVIEDEIPPVVVIEQDVILQLVEGANGLSFANAHLNVDMVDEGSFDYCSDVTMSLSKSFFTASDIGENIIELTVTDVSGNFNIGYATVTVLGPVDFVTGDCISETVNATPFTCGPATIYAEDFIDPSISFENPTISYNGVNFSSFLSGDELSSGANTIYVRYNVGPDYYECNGILNVVDNFPPVVVLEPEVTVALFPNNAGVLTADLAASSVDDGSYDACSNITLALSQSLFTEADLGENLVTLTVTDENGNWNQGVTIVNVIDGGDCFDQIEDLIVWPPAAIQVYNANATPSNISTSELVSNFGFLEEEVYPTIMDFCETATIGISYDDEVTFTSTGWEVLRTFTAMNWNNSSTGTFTQLITYDETDNNGLACLGNSTVLVDNGPITLSAEDMLVGYNGEPSMVVLVITDENEGIVVGNTITSAYVGQTLTAVVSHLGSGNSCWVSVEVIGGFGSVSCNDGPGESFSWPNSTIFIHDLDAEPTDLLPGLLVTDHGFNVSEVTPTWGGDCEAILSSYFEDVIVDLGSSPEDNLFEIERTWTVVDLNMGYEFVQNIKKTINPLHYICDTLDRTTPLGDCESGHTDTDDVEWPADIAVADHRISPEELVNILGIDSLDAKPSFYNSPESYTYDYVDVVKSFTSSTLVLERVWTVYNADDNNVSWSYTQEIEIDLTGFDNLVTTSTMTGKALSDVIINGDLMTNEKGTVTVEDGNVVSIQKQSDFSSGVDLRDLILIKDHILAVAFLDDLALLAADLNNDNQISTIDLVLLRNELLENSQTNLSEWIFVKSKQADGAPLPAAAYVGIKPGDVDDSYTNVAGKIIEDEVEVSFDDRLLNKGESYEIEVFLNKTSEVRGGRLVFELNDDVLDVNQITHTYDGDIEWNVNTDGKLIILTESTEGFFMVDSEDAPLFTISATALENGVLNENLALDEEERSLFIDRSYDYNVLEGNVSGVISSTFDDPSNPLSFVSVYPNPAVNVINIELHKVDIQDVQIELLNTSGQVVLSKIGSSSLDVSTLPSGLYVYKLYSSGNMFFNKVLIIK